MRRCSICGGMLIGYGNNAQPINDGRCCDSCNEQVIAARIAAISFDNYMKKLEKEEQNEVS